MLKKSVYALALCGLVSGQAFALTNTGFEAGTGTNPAGWMALGAEGVMTSVASGTRLYTVNDENGPGNEISFVHDDGAPGTGVLAADGSNFGMLEICPASTAAPGCGSSSGATATYGLNLAGPVSNGGDIMWLRLMTEDYSVGSLYNDKISVSYYGASSTSALATDSLSVSGLASQHIYYDSGWVGFAVPVGTQNLIVSLTNADPYNRPIGLLDYTAAPVPEADSVAMMMAGLGVLGFVSRRRRAGKAA